MPNLADVLNMIADPFVQTGLLAAVGAIVTRIVLRGHPKRRLVGQLAFFVALTALLLYHGIVPYEAGPPNASTLQRIFVGIAKVIWWTNAAWSLISIVRVFLIFERQPREGRLLQDLIVGIIYGGAILSVVAYVFNAPVGTLIATSGAVAIVLGLALQSTLGDVFSGIALNLARPYGVGDWLVLGDEIEGKVVETNWRATHLLTAANDLVVVPNSDLAKARLTNLSSPERSHGVTISVQFRPTAAPSAMSDVMRSVLMSSNTILTEPEPSVQVTSLDSNAVGLDLSFSVAEIDVAAKAKSEIFDLIYRHAKATGLILSSKGGDMTLPLPDMEASPEGRTSPRRLLDAIALFASMTEDEKDALAATMSSRAFRKGELLAEQGAVLASLMIMRSGIVTVVRRDETAETELARLAPGDFFGEGGLLTGARAFGSIRALTFVVVYEINQDCLAPLMRDRPAIADELGSILSKRSADELFKFRQLHGTVGVRSEPRLAARIRSLFNL